LITNDKFKSVEHRVLAKRTGPRISVATFFYSKVNESKRYGPIEELLSEDNPPVYRETLANEYFSLYRSRGIDKGSAPNSF
ncbi:1-aminocyclopropane-1-carboxylate oxidase-like protein, partial [Thalictrum thalictroides]